MLSVHFREDHQISASTATALVHFSDQLGPWTFLSLSQPPCALYQYCNVEISSNTYSSFKFSGVFCFFKGAIAKTMGLRQSTGMTAVPPTKEEVKNTEFWIVHILASLCVWCCMSHTHKMWLTGQQQFTTLSSSTQTRRPLFGMMLIKNSTQQ